MQIICDDVSYRPDLINYDELKATQPLTNLNNAFDVAEKELGIARLLDAEGVCTCGLHVRMLLQGYTNQ